MAQVELTVNGVARHLEPDDGETLLQTLRERLGLVAAKVGCSQDCGACGAARGSPALACMLQTAKLGGRRIVTLEGYLTNSGSFSPERSCRRARYSAGTARRAS